MNIKLCHFSPCTYAIKQPVEVISELVKKSQLEDGASAGAGDGLLFSSTRVNPSFLIISSAISSFALSDGWYSSQNRYLLLSLHNVDAGTQVRAGLILPNEQHGESELSNPAITKL